MIGIFYKLLRIGTYFGLRILVPLNSLTGKEGPGFLGATRRLQPPFLLHCQQAPSPIHMERNHTPQESCAGSSSFFPDGTEILCFALDLLVWVPHTMVQPFRARTTACPNSSWNCKVSLYLSISNVLNLFKFGKVNGNTYKAPIKFILYIAISQ